MSLWTWFSSLFGAHPTPSGPGTPVATERAIGIFTFPGAVVELQGIAEKGVTDATGYFCWKHVPSSLGASHVFITIEKFEPYSQHVDLTSKATAVNQDIWVGAQRLPAPSATDILLSALVSLVPPLGVIHTQGRTFQRADGTSWDWRGMTQFRLLEMVAHGREVEVIEILRQAFAAKISILRVLSMKAMSSGNLFDLQPAEGLAALPRLLDLAAQAGEYVEVVALADTALISLDHASHVRAIGAICAEHPNSLVEIANEPIHETQDARLRDPAYLLSLRSLIPSTVLCALGAAHGADDSNRAFTGGDYVTVHADRADGENGWRWVRHQREEWDIAIESGKPVVNDETMKVDLATDKQWATGALMAMLSLGDTFHYPGGLLGQFPTGDELTALEARRTGWDAIGKWNGLYYNVGSTGPLAAADFSHVLRAYSSIAGGAGWALAVAVDGDPGIVWRAPWHVVVTQDVGKARLYQLAQG